MLPFVGPSYTLPDRAASSQRAVNLYLQIMETLGKAQSVMQVVPGCELFANMGPADAPPPPPPPPSAPVVFNFDFEAVDVESYETADPNDQYATTSFDGYYVTWTGNMLAQNAEYTGLLPEDQPGYRAILGRDPAITDTSTYPSTRFDVTVPFRRTNCRIIMDHLGECRIRLYDESGVLGGILDLDLFIDPVWTTGDTGWFTWGAPGNFSYALLDNGGGTTSFGLWFVDNIQIHFSDTTYSIP